MTTLADFRKKFLKRVLPTRVAETVGVLCSANGSFEGNSLSCLVDDRGGYVYVKLFSGQIIQAYAGAFDNPFPGLIVRLGKIPGTNRLQVSSAWDVHGTPNPGGDQAEPHDHTWPSPQTTWVRQEQVLVWTVIPVGAFIVRVFGGIVFIGGAWSGVNNIDMDVIASKPTTGARWVLIQMDGAKNVTTKNGSIVQSKEALRAEDMPGPDANNWPIAAVRLYDSQESILQGKYDSDIRPLAWGTGYSFGNIIEWGDMFKAIYDPNDDGVVKDSDKLGGALPSAYMTKADYDTDLDGAVNDIDIPGLVQVTESQAGDLLVLDRGNARKKIEINDLKTVLPIYDESDPVLPINGETWIRRDTGLEIGQPIGLLLALTQSDVENYLLSVYVDGIARRTTLS